MEPLKKLKTRLGIDRDDDLLQVLLDDATDMVLDIIGRDTLPARLDSVAVQLAVIAYNRQGSEGEASRAEGGMSASFLDDLPADMQRRIRHYPRKVRVIRDADDETPS